MVNVWVGVIVFSRLLVGVTEINKDVELVIDIVTVGVIVIEDEYDGIIELEGVIEIVGVILGVLLIVEVNDGVIDNDDVILGVFVLDGVIVEDTVTEILWVIVGVTVG